MAFTYDDIVKWMKSYFETYNKYAQLPETVDKMNDYFAPDLVFKAYIAGLGDGSPVTDREVFKRILSAHPNSYETFEPLDIAVDERKMVVAALLDVDVIDRTTEKVVVEKHYLVRYQLKVDENNTLKIKQIDFFWEVLPPGVPDVDDFFGRNLDKEPA
jgi:hypothetical protein